MLPWAIFLGGIAQLIASNYDAKHNNVFGATAFAGYGLFWLGTGMSWMIQNGLFGEVLQASFDPNELGFAFLGYFIFTVFMTVGALETNKVLFFIFFLIDFLFLGLFMSTFGIATDFFHMMAAVAEFLISILIILWRSSSFFEWSLWLYVLTNRQAFWDYQKIIKVKPSVKQRTNCLTEGFFIF